MRRATQSQKTKLKTTGSLMSVDDEYTLNNSGPYKTPQKFGKQIQQYTYECNKNFPMSKEMQCAIINHQICQRLNSPSTQNTMSQILDRYRSQTLTKHECNDSQQKVSKLVKSVMKIQKYKWSKNMSKFNECVKQLKVKYSVHDAARTLRMHYSQLHSLLSSKKMSQQLPYKRFKKLHFLCNSLAVAYETYTKEQIRLGFKVLSQSSVYRCLK